MIVGLRHMMCQLGSLTKENKIASKAGVLFHFLILFVN